jgi:alpha-tubulin suppressor-like RCC1 family protein
LRWDYKVQVFPLASHVIAVTKVGQLFTWDDNRNGCLGHKNWSKVELWSKQVKDGWFAELFIVCASAGHYRSAAIDSFGLVPIPLSTVLDIVTL